MMERNNTSIMSYIHNNTFDLLVFSVHTSIMTLRNSWYFMSIVRNDSPEQIVYNDFTLIWCRCTKACVREDVEFLTDDDMDKIFLYFDLRGIRTKQTSIMHSTGSLQREQEDTTVFKIIYRHSNWIPLLPRVFPGST